MTRIVLEPEADREVALREYRVLGDVGLEIARARAKFGPQTGLSDLEWFAVLGEEFGEVARDVTQLRVPPLPPAREVLERQARIRAELLQVAAVAVRWAVAIDARASQDAPGE